MKLGRIFKAPFTGVKKVGEAVENKVVKETIKGLIRHILTAAGGALIANGTLSGNDIDLLAGAIVAVGGVVWSVFQKRKS